VTIVVPPGTRLTFQNTDPFKHRLYGVGVKTFPPNDSNSGATRDWTVPEAGTYEIRDELAPSLRTFVVSEPNVATVSYPSLKGEFQLSVDEPGDYTVQAFFAGKKIGPAIAVAVDGRDVDISRTPIKVGDKATAAAADKAEQEDKKKAEEREGSK
jgi:hypothetical protein